MAARNKRVTVIFLVLILTALVSFISGVWLQKGHAFVPLKRMLQGRLPHQLPPSGTILDWNLKKRVDSPPKYDLSMKSFQEIESSKNLFAGILETLIRLSNFPHDFQSQAQILEREEFPKFWREKIRIEVEPELWIPFYLFIPKANDGPKPTLLVFHGHSAGKVETAGIVPSYQKGNAKALAEAGFVTAAPDFRGFGELGWQGEWEDPLGHEYGRSIHVQSVIWNLEFGRTALAGFIYDTKRILDYLQTRPEVDSSRVGVAGTSMGADVAIWLAILDPRIKVIIASSSPVLAHSTHPSVGYGRHHICINSIPGIRQAFRLKELPLLIVPRPFLIDLNWQRSDAPYLESFLQALYKDAGVPERLSLQKYSGDEVFHNKTAIEWAQKWL